MLFPFRFAALLTASHKPAKGMPQTEAPLLLHLPAFAGRTAKESFEEARVESANGSIHARNWPA